MSLCGHRGLLAALLSIGIAFASQGAYAHAQFLDSIPAEDATLDDAPHEIVLNFSQAVTPVLVTLLGPDGNPIDTGTEASANGARVILDIPQALATGNYAVSFRVLSGDSHPIEGGLRFSIKSPGSGEEPANGAATAQSAIATSEPGAVLVDQAEVRTATIERVEQAVRALYVAVLMFAVGLILFRASIRLPASLDYWVINRSRVLGAIGMILTIIYFLVTTIAVAGWDAFQPRHLYIVLQTSVGTSLWLAMLGFLLLAMSGSSQRIFTGIAIALLIVSRVVTGHPASQSPSLLLVPTMAIHVATAGFWFASLWVLLRLMHKGPLADAPVILDRFARVAMWSVGALLAVGVVMAGIHLRSVDALLSSDYGNTLLWKLIGVAGLLVIAMVNKFWLTPQLASSYEPKRLRQSIRLEALVMLAVIAVSTILAATPPATKALETTAMSLAPRISVNSDSGNFTLIVMFSSEKYDENQPLSFGLFDANGVPYSPLEVQLALTIPSRRIHSLPLPVASSKENHFVVRADFVDADDTHFEALILVTDFDRERFLFDRGGRIER